MRRASAILVACAAGLALADSSIVALALPEILVELDTTVSGVAAVIGVYTAVLAVGFFPALALARRVGAGHAAAGGLVVFALASLWCAAADALTPLLLARALQAAGGAVALVAAFDLMDAGGREGARGRRLWVAAAVFGTAAGPAIGGALTQAFDWRAIFVAQVPFALVCAGAAWALREPTRHEPPSAGFAARPAIALGALSAALTAVLFLLVLQLVAGWSQEPLSAAAGVSILPLAALLASRLPGAPGTRACFGALLVAAGTGALAFLPEARLAWTVVPQLLAGAGMGLALPALGGELLPERTAADAARVLAARHVGIVVALLALAPLVSGALERATERAQERGVALVLDAKLPPTSKLSLAPDLLGGVESQDPREGLQRAIDDQRDGFEGTERAEFDRLAQRADETLVAAVGEAFRGAFLLTAGLALLAGALLVPRGMALAFGVAALLAGGVVYAARLIAVVREPEPVVIANPCDERALPETGGITGFLQDRALERVDDAACRYGSSREELVLALADEAAARRYEERHGVDPRSTSGILDALLG